ncbi:hypothetical protein Q5P01_000312 [Channa striata]|uniref:Uncharacterized protein n=1 Tax=Channa striata TaxID=64152 RepID=A0AA88LFW6_CHASR|nr:hypothetical protein Q5P01_000312 [Channa striata]
MSQVRGLGAHCKSAAENYRRTLNSYTKTVSELMIGFKAVLERYPELRVEAAAAPSLHGAGRPEAQHAVWREMCTKITRDISAMEFAERTRDRPGVSHGEPWSEARAYVARMLAKADSLTPRSVGDACARALRSIDANLSHVPANFESRKRLLSGSIEGVLRPLGRRELSSVELGFWHERPVFRPTQRPRDPRDPDRRWGDLRKEPAVRQVRVGFAAEKDHPEREHAGAEAVSRAIQARGRASSGGAEAKSVEMRIARRAGRFGLAA